MTNILKTYFGYKRLGDTYTNYVNCRTKRSHYNSYYYNENKERKSEYNKKIE